MLTHGSATHYPVHEGLNHLQHSHYIRNHWKSSPLCHALWDRQGEKVHTPIWMQALSITSRTSQR